ncbi:MAG: hypothetical protein DRH11_11460 [Deltaproteobacteria bacterium]|nr:MAG: hypothetical protein DRH11_11460 [Deltaproteobacteria bacterium]
MICNPHQPGQGLSIKTNYLIVLQTSIKKGNCRNLAKAIADPFPIAKQKKNSKTGWGFHASQSN